MDHDAAMRSAFDRINAGDIDGFGALLADDFVEHEETPGAADEGRRPEVLPDAPDSVP